MDNLVRAADAYLQVGATTKADRVLVVEEEDPEVSYAAAAGNTRSRPTTKAPPARVNVADGGAPSPLVEALAKLTSRLERLESRRPTPKLSSA